MAKPEQKAQGCTRAASEVESTRSSGLRRQAPCRPLYRESWLASTIARGPVHSGPIKKPAMYPNIFDFRVAAMLRSFLALRADVLNRRSHQKLSRKLRYVVYSDSIVLPGMPVPQKDARSTKPAVAASEVSFS